MKLHDIAFLKLLPQFMREDSGVKGLAKGIEIVVKKLDGSIKSLSTWDSIEKLGEAELDELAWELNVFWYDKSAPLDVKRLLIRDADLVHSRLGTKWAVKKIITEYFGSGRVREWFEYEGEPFHFKIISGNPTITNEKLLEFLGLLDKVKRQSAVLDGIYITLTGEMNLYLAMGLHEAGTERYSIGANPV